MYCTLCPTRHVLNAQLLVVVNGAFQVVREYHAIQGPIKHSSNWDLSTIPGLPSSGKLDLAEAGLQPSYMSVTVHRNLKGYPLPGSMAQSDRTTLEQRMLVSVKKLMALQAEFGGEYHSLTPDTEFSMNLIKFKKLAAAETKLMEGLLEQAEDPKLKAAGIVDHWPIGRGVYISADRECAVWVGGEDHFRIVCGKTGTVLNDVFDRVRRCLEVIEEDGQVVVSPNYGHVTSCPGKLGSGMRAALRTVEERQRRKGLLQLSA